MNVQAQVTALIDEMRGVLAVRGVQSPKFEAASDRLETLVRACIEPPAKELDWQDAFGLTKKESRIFGILHARRGKCVRKHALMDAMYFDIPNSDVDIKIVDIFICKIRQKLAARNSRYRIETVWAEGYRMSALEAVRA